MMKILPGTPVIPDFFPLSPGAVTVNRVSEGLLDDWKDKKIVLEEWVVSESQIVPFTDNSNPSYRYILILLPEQRFIDGKLGPVAVNCFWVEIRFLIKE